MVDEACNFDRIIEHNEQIHVSSSCRIRIKMLAYMFSHYGMVQLTETHQYNVLKYSYIIIPFFVCHCRSPVPVQFLHGYLIRPRHGNRLAASV